MSRETGRRSKCPCFTAEALNDGWNLSVQLQSILYEVATNRYIKPVRAVEISVLNSRLSEYVHLAAAGETILVTDRDRVVAELGPPRDSPSPVSGDAVLADLVRKGWLTPPARRFEGPPPAPKPVLALQEILADLEVDRSDR